MNPITYLIIIVVCVLVSAFFSGSETALLRLRKEQLDKDIRAARGPAVIAVRDLLQSTSRLLITILLGNNIVNVVAATFASALAIHYLGESQGVLVASVIMTIVILLCSEILPKAIAARNPKKISYMVGLPLYLIHQTLRPIHSLFDRVIDPLVRKISGTKEDDHHDRVDEILALARKAREASHQGSPIAIISGAADAAEMTVSDIMISRAEIIAFPVETPAPELLDQLLSERYTRAPIYKESLDKILGLIHLKDLIKLVRNNGTGTGDIIKPILRVPERKPILQLLSDMQRAFIHMAIVKDEFSVTMGLVTQEDILEEIVGEIRDEFDREELLTTKLLPDGSYEALGRLHVTDFNRQTGWGLKAERGDTLSGVVFNSLGRSPRQNDRINIPDYSITVQDVSGSRITRVRIQKLNNPP